MNTLTTHQRSSLAALICQAETLIDSATLPEETETVLRWIVTQNHIAFGMPTKYERPATNIMDLHDRTMSMLKSWMGQDNLSSPDAALDLIRPLMAEEATNV